MFLSCFLPPCSSLLHSHTSPPFFFLTALSSLLHSPTSSPLFLFPFSLYTHPLLPLPITPFSLMCSTLFTLTFLSSLPYPFSLLLSPLFLPPPLNFPLFLFLSFSSHSPSLLLSPSLSIFPSSSPFTSSPPIADLASLTSTGGPGPAVCPWHCDNLTAGIHGTSAPGCWGSGTLHCNCTSRPRGTRFHI